MFYYSKAENAFSNWIYIFEKQIVNRSPKYVDSFQMYKYEKYSHNKNFSVKFIQIPRTQVRFNF